MYRSTREVGMLLGVLPGRINRAVWEGRLKPPSRGPSGSFLWTRDDARRACWVLLRRDLDNVLAERKEVEGDGNV